MRNEFATLPITAIDFSPARPSGRIAPRFWSSVDGAAARPPSGGGVAGLWICQSLLANAGRSNTPRRATFAGSGGRGLERRQGDHVRSRPPP